MKNANAIAAAFSGAAALGSQWLAQHYLHQEVSAYWKSVISTSVIFLVLAIGRDGIKGGLSRLWNGSKVVWSGSPAPEPVPAAKLPAAPPPA